MSEQTFDRVGQHGESSRHTVCGLAAKFHEEPRNFLFAHKAGPGTSTPIYIGQIPDLSQGFDNPTRCHAYVEVGPPTSTCGSTARKLGTERRSRTTVIATWAPACND